MTRRSTGLDYFSDGDFETYWTWHLNQERQRVHQSRYLDGALPRAA